MAESAVGEQVRSWTIEGTTYGRVRAVVLDGPSVRKGDRLIEAEPVVARLEWIRDGATDPNVENRINRIQALIDDLLPDTPRRKK